MCIHRQDCHQLCYMTGRTDCEHLCHTGHEFCTELRKTVPDAVVPVIMVSAKNDEANIVEGLSHGCNDFVRYACATPSATSLDTLCSTT